MESATASKQLHDSSGGEEKHMRSSQWSTYWIGVTGKEDEEDVGEEKGCPGSAMAY
jgi:hypothetical protein